MYNIVDLYNENTGVEFTVDTITSTSTWVKPDWAKKVTVFLLGGGSGGGSGRRGATTDNRTGGGGGAGSGYWSAQYEASTLPATVLVTIGQGGLGGASVTTNDTDGNAGQSGGATSFSSYITTGTTTGGDGGDTSTGVSGGNMILALSTFLAQQRGSQGWGGFPSNGQSSTAGQYLDGSLGGGGGAGANASSTTTANGGTYQPTNWLTTYPTWLFGAGGTNGGNGGNGSNNQTGYLLFGSSGGGGSYKTGQATGNGGNGGYGAGGGGGAASDNGFNSGAGGNGGNGLCIIICEGGDSGTGGGIPIGNRGDITVTDGGNTWTINNDAVTNAKIGTGAVTETKIANDSVTYDKIQNISSASKLLGRGDSGSGNTEEITIGSGLTMTGTTLSASGGGGGYPTSETISSGAVDTSKTISYITGNVTIGSAPKGTIKYIVNDNDDSFYLETPTYSGGGFNSLVKEQGSDNIIIVGDFTSVNAISNTSRIAKYNPITKTYSSFATVTGTTIHRAKYDSLGNLWVVGAFSNIGGTACSNIAYFNGTAWVAGNVGTIIGEVRQIIFDNANPGRYWICGAFTTANGVTVNRFTYFNGTTYVAYGTGINTSTVVEMMQDAVTNHIYMVGEFGSVNGLVNTSRIVRFNPSTTTFSAVGTTNFCDAGTPLSVYANNDIIYLVGNSITTSIPLSTIATTHNMLIFNGTNWSIPLNRTGNRIRQIRYINNTFFVIGDFSNLVASNNTGTDFPFRTGAGYMAIYDPVLNKFIPYGATGSQITDMIFVNTTYYTTTNSGIVAVQLSKISTFSTIGSIKVKPMAFQITNSVINNIVAGFFTQKGSTLLLISDGTNWSIPLTQPTNESFGYYLGLDKYA
jgi:hypothetical protein